MIHLPIIRIPMAFSCLQELLEARQNTRARLNSPEPSSTALRQTAGFCSALY